MAHLLQEKERVVGGIQDVAELRNSMSYDHKSAIMLHTLNDEASQDQKEVSLHDQTKVLGN